MGAKYTVRVSKHHCGQTFGNTGGARDYYFSGDLMISGDLMTFLHIVFKEISPSTQIYIHSHLDLNSVSSSTDMMKRLGPVPSSWRIPAPHVDLRRAAVSGGKHFPECETSGSQFA